MNLETLTVGPLQENCYLLADAAGGRAVLVDPGDESERLLAALDDGGLALEAVWLTHAHFDHVGALADVVDATGAPVYMHPADAPLLASAAQAAALWEITLRPPPKGFVPLAPGQKLTFGNLEASCLYTPGHAPGHMSFHFPSEGLVLAGDALFKGSIGRTDLPFGDHAQLLASIRKELLSLPPDTRVYPGHGPATTIGEEAQANPFLA